MLMWTKWQLLFSHNTYQLPWLPQSCIPSLCRSGTAQKVHSVVANSSHFTFIRTQHFSLARHTNAIIYILPFTPLRNHCLFLYLALFSYAPTEPVSKVLALISFHDCEQFLPGSLPSVRVLMIVPICVYKLESLGDAEQ